MERFAIYALEAGGGQLGLCPLPGALGPYGADLARLIAWRPDLVLSMTQAAEREAAGAASLDDDLRTAGIGWQPLPIADFGAPCPDTQAAWPDVSQRARAILADGGRVLAHCRGGCGRSGMVALRLMVELGENPKAALTRLRARRPCAVETEAQRRWAQAI